MSDRASINSSINNLERENSKLKKEREQYDRRRDEFVKSQGYKILRIKSKHKIPTVKELTSTIEKMVKEDKKYYEITLSDWE